MEAFLGNLGKVRKSYDILAIAYERIIKEKQKKETEIFRQFKEGKYQEIYAEISTLFEALGEENLSLLDACDCLKSLLIESSCPVTIFCCAIIYNFDLIFELRVSNTLSPGRTSEIGPLNSIDTQNEVLIYAKPQDSLLTHLYEKANLREQLYYNLDNISNYLANYILIKKIWVDNKVPKILLYKDKIIKQQLEKDNNVNIALVPFYGKPWLDIKKGEATFSILPPNQKIGDDIINRYKIIINKLIADGINIAVFPEMTLTSDALEAVKEILKANYKKSALRLLICGTIWDNYTNTVHVLAANGDEILEYKKVSSYSFTDENGNKYEEDLRGPECDICFLEMYGLGRIFITICKDFLNASQGKYPSLLECSMSIVSSYSTSETTFKAEVNSLCQAHNLTLLCNCCTPRIEKPGIQSTKVGFVSLPGKQNTEMKSYIQYYEANRDCQSQCEANACYHHYQIFPYKIVNKSGIQTILIKQNKRIIMTS